MTSALGIAARIEAANQEAHSRILRGDPVLAGVQIARQAMDGLPERVVMHAGPPITWERMCGPQKSGVLGAVIFEGWAKDPEEAEALVSAGEIELRPNHDIDAVGPMTGITSPSMAVMVVENRTFGNRAFTTIHEGAGNVMRYGGNDSEVIDRLGWIANRFAPALDAALRNLDGVPLKSLVARGLAMGDDMHMRVTATSSLILRELAPALAESASDVGELAEHLRFVAGNDFFFLNIAMAAAKSMIAAADGIEASTVVTAMARNGTDFGVRVSATGDTWFTAPAEVVKGLYLPGFSAADANPDLGDSCIVETVGLGGCAMAASPGVVALVGAGTMADALDYSRRMGEITIGPNPEWTLPTDDGMGAPTGIDVRKVLETGIVPVINTAIAHRDTGRKMVGAGVARAPLACFEKALEAFAETIGV